MKAIFREKFFKTVKVRKKEYIEAIKINHNLAEAYNNLGNLCVSLIIKKQRRNAQKL